MPTTKLFYNLRCSLSVRENIRLAIFHNFNWTLLLFYLFGLITSVQLFSKSLLMSFNFNIMEINKLNV